ncbi:hypothetical protein Cgig2_014525 [Carnegiea gigantea]|uniref:RRM domain-containing protein n=1 Tax=Carnegiea gigantea TaxID=171969 RepID=A0A9Q1KGM0_9CARY|nr:hypothetical protein Cgig2_014525 [Carnegiea gigantea]
MTAHLSPLPAASSTSCATLSRQILWVVVQFSALVTCFILANIGSLEEVPLLTCDLLLTVELPVFARGVIRIPPPSTSLLSSLSWLPPPQGCYGPKQTLEDSIASLCGKAGWCSSFESHLKTEVPKVELSQFLLIIDQLNWIIWVSKFSLVPNKVERRNERKYGFVRFGEKQKGDRAIQVMNGNKLELAWPRFQKRPASRLSDQRKAAQTKMVWK